MNDSLKIEYPKRKPLKPEAVIEVGESDLFDYPIGVDEVYNDQSSNN